MKLRGTKRKWVNFFILINELKCNSFEWRNFMRMDDKTYLKLPKRITPKIRLQYIRSYYVKKNIE